MIMENSDIPYTEREIIQRAIDSAKPRPGERPKARWELVKRIFMTGQTVSRLICYRYGFDPDKEIHAPNPYKQDKATEHAQ